MEIKIGLTESATLPSFRPRWLDGECQRFGSPGVQSVHIRTCESAFANVHRHAASSDDEIGGVLIGEAFEYEGEYFIDVEAAIAGEMTQAGPSHVTFTADTWARLLRQQERLFPAKRIVGWYHSHPRMGIFLSGMDLAIHENFFPQPWHIALVVNGQDQKAGFFVWDRGRIKPSDGFFWHPSQSRYERCEIRPAGSRFNYRLLDSPAYEGVVTPPLAIPRWLWLGTILFGVWAVLRWLRAWQRRRRHERGRQR